MSSLLALSTVSRFGRSAGVATARTGEWLARGILDHYSRTIDEIHTTGYIRYLVREFRPYLRAAALQFSPERRSSTQKLFRRSTAVMLCCVALGADAQVRRQRAPAVKRAAPVQAVGISPSVLKGHVSFLASDALLGRATPSRELEVAAEYIAAQYRRIGLDPLKDGSYFQRTADEVLVDAQGRAFRFAARSPVDTLVTGPLFKVTDSAALPPRARVVIAPPTTAAQLRSKPPLLIALGETGAAPVEGALMVSDDAFRAAFESLPEGRTSGWGASLPAGLKNVIGLLRGFDPVLRDQFVLVTAHYDHVGEGPPVSQDRIYNGANDNASGVAAMIEAAASLAASKPRRSIAFIALFGEEKGLLGSRYYVADPAFPLENTVAVLNLEQLGRTDDTQGPRDNTAFVTGFDFSEVGGIVRTAAASAGVMVPNPPGTDDYFNRSDNVVFAERGVPAHTLGVAFLFPDYHRPADEWLKIDYLNMAKVTRAVAASVLAIANRTDPPRWLTVNPKAEPYAGTATRLAAPRISAPTPPRKAAHPDRLPPVQRKQN
jgi:hypothetical protein